MLSFSTLPTQITSVQGQSGQNRHNLNSLWWFWQSSVCLYWGEESDLYHSFNVMLEKQLWTSLTHLIDIWNSLSFGSSRMYIKDARPLFHLSLVGFSLTTQIYLSQHKTLVIIVS